ncbi:MAG: hypothetical protein PVF49_07285 [Anaerolineales bacterium]
MPDSRSGLTKDPSLRPLLISLAIELLIYFPLVTLYFFFILKYAEAWLFDLYSQSRVWYAAMAIIVITVQGILLEALTSWLIRRFGLR